MPSRPHTDTRRGPRPGGPAIQAARFTRDGDEYVVFSFPQGATQLPARLSLAERAVATSILAGRSNAAIAQERGTSLRTVANQVASVFRKCGVNSRAEFIARVAGSARRA